MLRKSYDKTALVEFSLTALAAILGKQYSIDNAAITKFTAEAAD